MSEVVFTVSTQTYNRIDSLPRVYESLKAQTFRGFEWLIVDDGSTDGTGELVKAWQAAADFPIRYFYQPNRGKHIGFNRSVVEAQGELLLSFDSDDSCAPNALERFKSHWDSIADKEDYSTVSALCMNEQGHLIGDEYPEDVRDASSFSEQYRLRRSERWGVNRTDVLRKYPFPEIESEHFVPEALIWNRIALRYKARFVNEKLRIYHQTPGSVMSSLSRVRLESPKGASLYYFELSRFPVPFLIKVKALANYIRFSFHAGTATTTLFEKGFKKLLTMSVLPVGYLMYRRDRFLVAQKSPVGRVSLSSQNAWIGGSHE